jgi:hypothetical protein
MQLPLAEMTIDIYRRPRSILATGRKFTDRFCLT